MDQNWYTCSNIHSFIGHTRNSSADEIANVNLLRRHRTHTAKYKKEEKNKQISSRYIAHNKVHFAYGKHPRPQLPN